MTAIQFPCSQIIYEYRGINVSIPERDNLGPVDIEVRGEQGPTSELYPAVLRIPGIARDAEYAPIPAECIYSGNLS